MLYDRGQEIAPMVIGVDNKQEEETLVLGKSIRTFPSSLLSEAKLKIKNWEFKTGNSLTKTKTDVVLECFRINRVEDRGITVLDVKDLGYSPGYASSIIFDFRQLGLVAPVEGHRIKNFKQYFLIFETEM